MKKGKLGIVYPFYAVFAFILALFGQTLLCALVMGVAMVVERDEWASRQCIQALLLSLVVNVLTTFAAPIRVYTYSYYVLEEIMSVLGVIVLSLISIVWLVFIIMGIARTAKGKEAGIPLAAALARWAYGIAKPKPVYNQPPYGQQPYGGQQPPAYGQAPQQGQQPYTQQGQQQAYGAPRPPQYAPPQGQPPYAAPPAGQPMPGNRGMQQPYQAPMQHPGNAPQNKPTPVPPAGSTGGWSAQPPSQVSAPQPVSQPPAPPAQAPAFVPPPLSNEPKAGDHPAPPAQSDAVQKEEPKAPTGEAAGESNPKED